MVLNDRDPNFQLRNDKEKNSFEDRYYRERQRRCILRQSVKNNNLPAIPKQLCLSYVVLQSSGNNDIFRVNFTAWKIRRVGNLHR